MENTKTKELKNKYEDTPLFKKVLKMASEVALSRFQLIKLVHKAFSRLAHPDEGKSLRSEALQQLGLFLRMMKAVIKRDYKDLPISSLVRITAAVIYFVMLVDIIPDFIPMIGFADDAFVLAWAYNGIRRDLEAFEAWENANVVDLEEDLPSEVPAISPKTQPAVVVG